MFNTNRNPLQKLLDNSNMSNNSESAIDVSDDEVPRATGGKKVSVERIYQKKTQLEHILLRPDTYIGSVETLTQQMWVYDGEEHGMVKRDITYVPGLYKIFDEILVNAADNKQRDKNMDLIKIDIDPENNIISIYNNGKGIPIVEHKVEKVFVPALIFGQLLTSSNYDDEEKKVTGGRNGFGAKLCNIFSTKFTVETACSDYKKVFKQTWTNNMTKTTDAKIKLFTGDDFTKITFSPDLSKFKMQNLDKDIVSLMYRRAYDVAGTSKGVKVYLNGKKLPIKNFKEYVDQYIKGKVDDAGNQLKVVYDNSSSQRWEVAVTTSETGFQQISFVNSIATTKGGRHVDYIVDQLTGKLQDLVKKKNKGGVAVKPFQIKSHMWVFVNCLIENPTFDSQTKENMTLMLKSFGSKCVLNEKYIAQVTKCGILDAIMSWVKFKAESLMNKKCHATKHSKLKGILKLEDANNAGTRHSSQCTLLVTEGDSAKTLAVSGLAVIGRDNYGVFPLRGKMLNVREASHKQILENAEINHLIKILGLQYKKQYKSKEDLQTLRYGKLMIMTDQDQDGSHIKGLLINFIHTNWPDLLRLPFLEEFITPIVKVSKGREKISFYSLPEFEEWKTRTDRWASWKVKYYKGLGTSTTEEAKEYFSDMDRHRILFKHTSSEDDKAITMAFSKKMVEARKEWLSVGMEDKKRRRELGLAEQYLYGPGTSVVTYQDFINKELILFSNLDNERSIPSLVDGLKPGQRKVLFTCFKRNDKHEVKVAQLAGSVAEHSAYHHGETSLMSTIINLAQNYVGSNNINLLMPNGMFGTRLQGGKDAASPRYIFTMLSPLAKHIFNRLDFPLLAYHQEDNQKIEPEWYAPIIPMILVNGADGIGTGWMTRVPNYNVRQLVDNLKRLIRGEQPVPMIPSFKNFRGTIEPLDNQRYVVSGEIGVIDDRTMEITELPIRTWTQAYKEAVLEPMLHGTDKVPSMISDYKEYNSDTTVRFLVSVSDSKMTKSGGLHKVFKLQTSVSTSSMVLFDRNGVLKRYNTPEEILTEFYELRMEYYVKRKKYILGMLEAECLKINNITRFILEKISGEIVIENRKRKAIYEDLFDRGFDSDPVKAWQKKTAMDQSAEEADDEEEEETDDDRDYNYLVSMQIMALSMERKDQLLKDRDAKVKELEELKKKTPSDLWMIDLEAFLVELDDVEEKERISAGEKLSGKVTKGKGKGRGGKGDGNMGFLTLPSSDARRVAPLIDPELKKKAEKAAGDAVKRARKHKDLLVSKSDSAKDESSDVEILSLSERIGASSKAKGDDKLMNDSDSDSFVDKKKAPSKELQSSIFDSLMGSSKNDSSGDANSNNTSQTNKDDDLTSSKESDVPAPVVKKRPAKPRKRNSSESSVDEPAPKKAKAAAPSRKPKGVSENAGKDLASKKKSTSRSQDSSDTDDYMPAAKKAAAAGRGRKLATKKGKVDSDDEEVAPKKTKHDVSDDDDSADDFARRRPRAARSKVPVKYNFGEDSEEDY